MNDLSPQLVRASALPPLLPHCPSRCASTRRTHRTPANPRQSRLGLASYTFRNFTRAQLIAFMKQLDVHGLNAKDVKDHLPIRPRSRSAGRLPTTPRPASSCTPGAPSTFKRTTTTISAPSSNTPSAPASSHRRRRSHARHTAAHREVRQAIRHPHRHPQSRARRQVLSITTRCTQSRPRHGPAHRLLHRRRPRVRAGTDVVEAIHAAGPRLFNMHVKDLTRLSPTRTARSRWATALCPSAKSLKR